MLETLLKRFGTYNKTCSITDICDKAVTFIRDEKYISHLQNVTEDIWVIAPRYLQERLRYYQEVYCPTVNISYTDYPEFEFTVYHNHINKNVAQSSPVIGKKCDIDPTVIIGVDGMKAVNCPNGNKIHFHHTGHVIIGDNVHIGPHTIIHRGTMGVTNIKSGCQIGCQNNIGHNCSIGSNNVIAAGVIFNGGVVTGNNCWFGSGSIMKHYITIDDNVVVGQGANVVKDINKSGIYVGNPAKFVREYEEGWNF
jgi:acetyltransferase-like isoleucine patch superfamily enzyme